jgi:hypothetical protein
VLAQERVGTGQVGHRCADRPCHVQPGPLGVRGGPAVAAAQPDRARQFAGQEVPFRGRRGGAAGVAVALGFLQLGR